MHDDRGKDNVFAKESSDKEWDIKVYVEEKTNEIMESLKPKKKWPVLVHAILVVIRTLRDHRGCGNIGSCTASETDNIYIDQNNKQLTSTTWSGSTVTVKYV